MMSEQRMFEAVKTDMMYADYKSGMSLSQVGAKWHYTSSAVGDRFYKRGFKLRSRIEGWRLWRGNAATSNQAPARERVG